MRGFLFVILWMSSDLVAAQQDKLRQQQAEAAGNLAKQCIDGLKSSQPQAGDIGKAVQCLKSLVELRNTNLEVSYQVSADGLLALRGEKKRESAGNPGKDTYYLFLPGRAFFCDQPNQSERSNQSKGGKIGNEPPKLSLNVALTQKEINAEVQKCQPANASAENIAPLMREICTTLSRLPRAYELSVKNREKAKEVVSKEKDKLARKLDDDRVKNSVRGEQYKNALSQCGNVNSKPIQAIAGHQWQALDKSLKSTPEPKPDDKVFKDTDR